MSFPKYNPDGPDAWPDMWVPNKLQDLPSAVEAYFELAGEFLARNQIETPRSLERKAAPPLPPQAKVRFWPYS